LLIHFVNLQEGCLVSTFLYRSSVLPTPWEIWIQFFKKKLLSIKKPPEGGFSSDCKYLNPNLTGVTQAHLHHQTHWKYQK